MSIAAERSEESRVPRFITFRKAFKGLTIPARMFVTKPEPCEPPGFDAPGIEVPDEILSKRKARLAQEAINEARLLVEGNYAPKISGYDTPGFKKAEVKFKKATGGTKLKEVFLYARARFLQS